LQSPGSNGSEYGEFVIGNPSDLTRGVEQASFILPLGEISPKINDLLCVRVLLVRVFQGLQI
jgi:hypothetical protein